MRLNALNKGDLFWDVVGRLAPDVGFQDIQGAQVGLERLGIHFGNLPDSFASARRASLHLVFAGVAIGNQMAHIGDIHDMIDLIAIKDQHPA